MKPMVLAVGLSLGLHLVLVAWFRGEDVVVAAPRERVVDGFVSFTPVVEAPVVDAAPRVAVAAAPAVRTLARASPGADLGMAVVEVETPAAEEILALGGELKKALDSARADRRGDTSVLAERGGGAPSPASGGGEGVVTAPSPPQSPGPELVALVHARLAATAEGCYPPAARRFQQRGTVQLSFCLDASGGAASTSVTQSSGAELLDAAAQGCVVQKAAPFPLEAASRCFSVPVRFGAR